MARTKKEIKSGITTEFMANETLAMDYGFAPGASFEQEFSLVSMENIIFEIVAFAIYVLELIFDKHKLEVDEALEQLKPHNPRWYRNKALAFQYGFNLIEDSDKYDNTGVSSEALAASKIIKYSAVVEAKDESRLIVKIATETGNQLHPIDEPQKEAFDAYIKEVRDAGVNITVINYLPDILRLSLRIFRDPLVLDENGVDRRTGKKPVEIALQEYMKELPFNGELILQELANKLEVVEGVKIVQVDQVQSKWIDGDLGNYGDFEQIDVREIPVSGYFEIENFNGVTYVV